MLWVVKLKKIEGHENGIFYPSVPEISLLTQ